MRIEVLGIVVAAALIAGHAHAQPATVTCESKGKARAECEMNTAGEVRMVRQLSKSSCEEGVSWGLSKHAVWVENGCRAVFENVSASAAPEPAAAAPKGGLPLLNASCPTGIDVHVDQGGPVYINGNEAVLNRSNDNYYEARDKATGVVVSLSRNPDGTFDVSYTGKGGANGICTVK